MTRMCKPHRRRDCTSCKSTARASDTYADTTVWSATYDDSGSTVSCDTSGSTASYDSASSTSDSGSM